MPTSKKRGNDGKVLYPEIISAKQGRISTDKDRIFTRNFLLLMGMNFCGGLNYFVLVVSIAGFSMDFFGANEFEAGVAVGIYVIGGLISRFVFGKYIELFGRKRMMRITLALALLMSCMYSFVNSEYGNIWMLYVVRFFHGMMYGLSYACITSSVSKVLPPHKRGEGMGYYFLSTTIAMCIGPLLGLLFSGKDSYTFIFTIGIFLYAISFTLSLFVDVEEEKLNEKQIAEAKSFEVKNIVEKSALPIAIACFVLFLGFSVINSFMSKYTTEKGFRDMATYFFLVVAAGTVISRLNGKQYDVKGSNILLIPGFISYTLGMVVYALTDNVVLFFASGFFIGFGYSIIFTVCQTIVLSRVETSRYGVTSSTYTSLVDMGTGCGPMILGLLIPVIGFSGVYLTAAGLAVVAFVIYWFVFGKEFGNIPGKQQQKVKW